MKADIGIQPEVTEQLRREARVDSLEEWNKYVAVVFDEVEVKEGIVYDKQECRTVDFVNFGDANNALPAFERSRSGAADHSVARHMFVSMVCGILLISTSFHMPNILYTIDMSAELLHPIAWEAVRTLNVLVSK